jgi:ribosomal-protein-alanine N-acetyltransferase
MDRMQLLRPEHASAVLEFERVNREYFAESISDRGDAYFAEFPSHLETLLAHQADGVSAFYVLVDDHGAIVGRFNLYEISGRSAVVGYRVARRVSGRGVATGALRELCRIARENHGLSKLRASVSDANVASRRVLEKAGFTVTGSTKVEGRDGAWYELLLSDRNANSRRNDSGGGGRPARSGTDRGPDPGRGKLPPRPARRAWRQV